MTRQALAPWARHVATPLLVGALVYPLRPLVGARHVFGVLPDAMWGYAFGAFIALVWRGEHAASRVPWLTVCLAVVLSAEIGQQFGVVPGTFDIVDLFASVAAFVLGTWLVGRGTPIGGPRV